MFLGMRSHDELRELIAVGWNTAQSWEVLLRCVERDRANKQLKAMIGHVAMSQCHLHTSTVSRDCILLADIPQTIIFTECKDT